MWIPGEEDAGRARRVGNSRQKGPMLEILSFVPKYQNFPQLMPESVLENAKIVRN